MKTRMLMVALGSAALLSSCSARQESAASEPILVSTAASSHVMTSAEMEDIRRQIERNWNVDPSNPCDSRINVGVTLARDGTVQRADVLDDFAGKNDCRAAQEGVMRAIFMSSPLKLPHGRYWPTLVLVFDSHLTM